MIELSPRNTIAMLVAGAVAVVATVGCGTPGPAAETAATSVPERAPTAVVAARSTATAQPSTPAPPVAATAVPISPTAGPTAHAQATVQPTPTAPRAEATVQPTPTAPKAEATAQATPAATQVGHSVGDLAPEFELRLDDGASVTLASLQEESQPAFLFFFTTW